MDLRDSFRGCLLGGAVGDALGMPYEGYSAEEISLKFGAIWDMVPAPDGHFNASLLKGQFTDDTQETLILAESLIESCGFSAVHFADKLKSWGQSLRLDGNISRGVGVATRLAVERLLMQVPWTDSGIDIPTCGSAMRAAPIGLVYHQNLDLVSKYAQLQSLPTHCSRAAMAASIAVATGIALSLNGFNKERVLKISAASASRVDEDFAGRLEWILSLSDLEARAALRQIGNSPLVNETVPAAFYCFLRFEPEEGLIKAVGGGGDTDSIAAIAGSLFGALHGSSWIPERWLTALAEKDRIIGVSQSLATLSQLFCR